MFAQLLANSSWTWVTLAKNVNLPDWNVEVATNVEAALAKNIKIKDLLVRKSKKPVFLVKDVNVVHVQRKLISIWAKTA